MPNASMHPTCTNTRAHTRVTSFYWLPLRARKACRVWLSVCVCVCILSNRSVHIKNHNHHQQQHHHQISECLCILFRCILSRDRDHTKCFGRLSPPQTSYLLAGWWLVAGAVLLCACLTWTRMHSLCTLTHLVAWCLFACLIFVASDASN